MLARTVTVKKKHSNLWCFGSDQVPKLSFVLKYLSTFYIKLCDNSEIRNITGLRLFKIQVLQMREIEQRWWKIHWKRKLGIVYAWKIFKLTFDRLNRCWWQIVETVYVVDNFEMLLIVLKCGLQCYRYAEKITNMR